MSAETPVLVFVGQPNCGKSTLFNAIAGLKAETSNFPGTTVKHTHSRVNVEGRMLSVVDLPGTYSLNPQDPAERAALTHLFQEKPDVIVNVVDASILGRSLALTLDLMELRRPMIIALNMTDLAEKKGIHVDVRELEAHLGLSVVPTVALHGRGVKELLTKVFEVLGRGGSVPEATPWSKDVESRILHLEEALSHGFPLTVNKRFTAVKMIEAEDLSFNRLLSETQPRLKAVLDRVRKEIGEARGRPAYEVIAAERHHLALKIFEESAQVRHEHKPPPLERLDDVIMHPILGYLVLLAVFLGFFFMIFLAGNFLENLLLGPFQSLRGSLSRILGDGLGFSLADGLIQGVAGGVAIVLPYFLPLLFLMALLEDVGYLARAGFLLDTFMHRIGLHGKSVSPFLIGFGCNVPAVMATRILESQRDRIITGLLIPFIPCSARTMIILALVAAFLGPWWALGFYVVNMIVIAVLGRVITAFYREPSPGLILEIPSLKAPSLKNMARKTWIQLLAFIKFAWPLLVAGSVVLSLLQHFGADAVLNAVLSPFVVHGLGLPSDLGVTLVFGFLRKELSLVMMLQALGVDYGELLGFLTRQQILVFVVFVNFFIPCLSTFGILWKELGRKVAFLSVAISITVAILLSLLVRLIF
ncbi:MAG: ferrous iron transport protein B [Candidatus Aminicenantes bacterium]|nr:ferrous iron transport protein B [Candidatus Aminicenantes bacterium]